MSSTTIPQTFLELATDLANRVRSDGSGVNTLMLAKRSINTALHDMHTGTGERFPWAWKHGMLVTHPIYNTGTLTCTQGSAIISIVGGSFTTLNVYQQPNGRIGGKLTINGAATTYELQQVSFISTISPLFLEASAAGLGYSYFEDEYDLAEDFLRPFNLVEFAGDLEIGLIGLRDFSVRYPRNNTPTERPRVATILRRAYGPANDVWRVRLSPPPSTAIAIPYDYITSFLVRTAAGARQTFMVSDDDEPIVPPNLRAAIVLHALANWYRDRKDDQREASARNDYMELVNRIMGDQGIGSQKPSLRPGTRAYRSRAQRPWSGGGGGRYDLNGRFDRMED